MANRYFQAFVEIELPWCTHKAWSPVINEIFLFEQPDMPSFDCIIATVKQDITCQRVTVTNLHEISETDFLVFMGGSSDWQARD